MLWIASPIAFASMAIGFGLRFAVVWGVTKYAAATLRPPPPPPPPATAPALALGPPATKPATKPAIPETPQDKAIRAKIENGELKEFWQYTPHVRSHESLFKKLMVVLPRHMYIETSSFLPPRLYVALP